MGRIRSAAGWTVFALIVASGIASVIPSPYEAVRTQAPIDATRLIAGAPPRAESAVLFPLVDRHHAKWSEVVWYRVHGGADLERRSAIARRIRSGTSRHTRVDVDHPGSSEHGHVSPIRLYRDSQQLATLTAARAADMDVTATGRGVRIWAERTTRTGSPLRSGDVLVAADGSRLDTFDDLDRVIARHRPGDTIDVVTDDGAPHHIRIDRVLGEFPRHLRTHYALGVAAVETRDPRVTAPRLRWVDPSRKVEGTSAGLALALAAFQRLTGERWPVRILATGEIGSDGHVYAVGDVRAKVRSVRRARARVFVVPAEDADAARANSDGVEVIGVASVDEAIRRLTALD